MKSRILILLFIIAGIVNANAQATRMAIGARATPDGLGASFKGFLDRNLAIEAQLNVGGIITLPGESFTAVGLLEYHIPLPDPAFRIYFGGGLHAGTWVNRGGHADEFIFGMDGIGGIEYVFKSIPLGISADLKPAINFVQEAEFFPHNIFGVSARYYFSRGHIRPAAPAAPARR